MQSLKYTKIYLLTGLADSKVNVWKNRQKYIFLNAASKKEHWHGTNTARY